MHDYFFSAVILLAVLVVGLKSAALYVPKSHIVYKSLYNAAQIAAGVEEVATTKDLISNHGYPVEQHHIVTEDGYVLGVFRIPYSHKLQNQKKIRPIVLIEHGLMGGSDVWFLNGPNHALPYLLADSGFDVWVGNSRGNTYSRNHISLNTEEPDFWNFSWHEIGYYDIAATIDYSLVTNGQGHKAIHYVGHSQGTTVFFTLMSLRPEYNEKIKTAHMFAPIAWMSNMEYKLVRNLSPYLGHQNIFTRIFANTEFLPYNQYILSIFSNLCGPREIFRPVCVYLIKSYYNSTRWNNTAMTEGIGHQPAGCSFNQILHYMQEHQSGRFCQYDYGSEKNEEMYGSVEPPDYPVENITSNVHLWYAQNDIMAAVKDVLTLADRLPNKKLHLVDDPLWDHDDFALNIDLRKIINEPVIEIMKKFESSKN